MKRREAAFIVPEPTATRGYLDLYRRSVMPASEGCDFDFLRSTGAGQKP